MVPPFPWVDCAAYILGLLVVPVLFEWAVGRDEWRDMGLRPARGSHPYVILVATVVGLVAYQRLIYRLLGQRLPAIMALGNLWYFAGLWACVALGEEFFLRSVLQRRLAYLWGHVTAIVITAALFGFAAHHSVPVVENALFRFPVGVVLGWLFARQKSILSPVAAHFLLNLAAFA